jgi:hypothetical protein
MVVGVGVSGAAVDDGASVVVAGPVVVIGASVVVGAVVVVAGAAVVVVSVGFGSRDWRRRGWSRRHAGR